MSISLTDPIFTDEDAAREHLEAQRWPDGAVCPHCGCVGEDHVTPIKGARARPSKAHPEGKERKGLYQCNGCRKQFTVTVKTVFERSKVPLNKWLAATYLLASSKKGMSAHQLHRMLGVTYKTAWFMFHRIREAMKEDNSTSGPLGGEGKIVEADETYIGKRDVPYVSPRRIKEGRPFLKSGGNQKRPVVSLVERGGRVRSFHVRIANKAQVRDILVRNADRKSKLYTDESRLYTTTGREYADHQTVNHSAGEYARKGVHTNTIENVFSVFKRGMIGVYQHCGEAHLHRYLSEFDFRYNRRQALGVNDEDRHNQLLKAVAGKRLTYRRTGEAALA
ncbi:MAG: IS1595 family transposase [Henriciella sp.]|uniref:IS1595 family transposase n=1 Tax=Henriciella sp. TaxID=1968823 RepID=UPI000C0F096A|nr:IS1595 family transposase [Henriciella sp.]MAN74098.1 IS1595 family transposase [Henriciella sp.]MBF34224.1 IS1595 family transposase [Hyphomonadaceae bacterium]MBK76633.1 IS1595 family transposase [Henriciella sp.]PHR75597.1 MAG: IS1595 family transposase [Henriciella sp.]|tara:strand:+ start:494 stop:1498 length:1005 start_codon:yes stop_codon:yes gene_type:complete